MMRLAVLIYAIVLVKTYAKDVLITGGAGFIGFHTAVKLAKDSDNKVVVLDIFDDSYSVDLKKARAGVLKEKGVVVHSGDVCNQQMLDHLFDHHKFEYVVHMAGKDGGSMESPDAFIRANTQCLLTLLRVLSSHKTTHLVYASSYNVLDKDYKGLTPAISLLSALKTGVEKFVSAYCEEFGLSTVGIRPFSVYGPWGRPDGDIYKMALEIDANKPVQIYTDKDSAVIASRDYTYIDDVVNGIVAAIDYKPQQCGEIFNIASGSTKPIAMDTVFTLLKDKMQKDAEKDVKSLPLYEPLQVLGDISTARTTLGYNPVVSIEEGITKFVEWFGAYHHEKKWEKSDPSNSLSKELEKEKIMYVNKKYKERLVSIRQEYEEKAIANGLPLTKYYHKTFKKYAGIDPGSHSRGNLRITSIPLLTDWCRIIDECVAFTSTGRLFSYISQQDHWKPSKNDFYVADINVCEAGLTTCYGNCTCTYKGPGQAENGCPEGYGILHKNEQQDFCYELYAKGKTTKKEKEFMILDKVENRDWNEFIKDKPFFKFSNKYFNYGVVAYYPKAKGDIDKLKAACDDTYHCIGFTDTGELKGIIEHVHKWKESHSDLYIRDVNYCKLHEEKCDCKRTKPGEYSCTGPKKP